MKFEIGSIVVHVVPDRSFMARVQGPWGRITVSIGSVRLIANEFTALYPVLENLTSFRRRLTEHATASTRIDHGMRDAMNHILLWCRV